MWIEEIRTLRNRRKRLRGKELNLKWQICWEENNISQVINRSINQCQITGCIVAKTMIFWWQKKITSLWKRKIRAWWQDERMEVGGEEEGGGLTSVSGEWWRSRQWRHRPAGVNTVSPPAVCLQSHWQTDDLTTRRAPLFIKPAVIFLDCSHNLGQKHSGCLAEM